MYTTKDCDYVIKIIIIGDTNVGKSNILSQITENKFRFDTLQTIGLDFQTKIVNICSDIVRVQIWDTAGQERFRSIIPSLYKNLDAVMFVYDITDADTFDSISFWLENIRSNLSYEPVMMLVGNKSDLFDKRVISQTKAKEFAKLNSMMFLEMSALTNNNISTGFDILVKSTCDKSRSDNKHRTKNKILYIKKNYPEYKNCC